MNTEQHQVGSTQMDMHSNPNPNKTPHAMNHKYILRYIYTNMEQH